MLHHSRWTRTFKLLEVGAGRSVALFALFALIPALFLVSGCGDDTTSPQNSSADFGGIWELLTEPLEPIDCGEGDARPRLYPIMQVGNQATFILDNVLPITLDVVGARATGRITTDNGTVELDFTLADGELTGTMIIQFTDQDCTADYSLTGSRVSSPPLEGFAGSWAMDLAVASSTCPEIPGDSTLGDCWTLGIDRNTVTAESPFGTCFGVAEGDSLTLWRFEGTSLLKVGLTLMPGEQLAGTVIFYDEQAGCQFDGTLAGEWQATPCPEPPSAEDFAGTWLTMITNLVLTCPDDLPSDYFGPCMTVTVQGQNITADDGSGRGLVTGTLQGSTAILTRQEAFGVYTLELELTGDGLMGAALMVYDSGACAGTTAEIEVTGTPLSTPCGSSADFGGYWDFSYDVTSNGCGLDITNECFQLIQDGGIVYSPSEALQGSVVGNTLTLSIQVATLTLEYELVLDESGESFSGTVTVVVEDSVNPENGCTTTANVLGTRTTGCG